MTDSSKRAHCPLSTSFNRSEYRRRLSSGMASRRANPGSMLMPKFSSMKRWKLLLPKTSRKSSSSTRIQWGVLSRMAGLMSMADGLVAEVSDSGKDHGHALGIGGGNDFLVPHGTARLDRGGGSRRGRGLQSVGKRKKGVRGNDRA